MLISFDLFLLPHSTLLSMSGGHNVDPALEDSGQVYAQRMGVCVDLDIPRHVVPLLEDADPDVRKEVRMVVVVVVVVVHCCTGVS